MNEELHQKDNCEMCRLPKFFGLRYLMILLILLIVPLYYFLLYPLYKECREMGFSKTYFIFLNFIL